MGSRKKLLLKQIVLLATAIYVNQLKFYFILLLLKKYV